MTEIRTFDPSGRAVSYVDEGEGPVSLVLIAERSVEADPQVVVAHYLAEEAGFRVVRIGPRVGGADAAPEQRAADAAELLDELGLQTTWIGGFGTGGTAARRFALDHADRVNGLLLLGVEDVDIALPPVIPVLIVQGSADETTPAVNGTRLHEQAPERVSVKDIEGGDHMFVLNHPIDVATIVEEYLDWD